VGCGYTGIDMRDGRELGLARVARYWPHHVALDSLGEAGLDVFFIFYIISFTDSLGEVGLDVYTSFIGIHTLWLRLQ